MSLVDFAENGTHHPMFKLEHYFDIYDRYFSKYKGRPVRILEIGVCDGGSLDLWNSYFGSSNVEIVGIDINPDVKKFERDNISIVIIDQEDRTGLETIFKNQRPFDIIVDDGGHRQQQQIKSFEALFPLLHREGTYLVEDIQTSYWKSYDGGLRLQNTFIEFSKKLSDYVNVHHFRSEDTIDIYPPLKNALKEELLSVSYYDGVVVFCKGIKPINAAFHYNGNGNTRKSSPLALLYL
jgi:hypothetical protein